MGIQIFPATTGGGIKSVQRGSAGAAGTVTITAVNIDKAFVNIFGTASSGAPALSGGVSAVNASINAANGTTGSRTGSNSGNGGFNSGNNNPSLADTLAGANVYGAYNGFQITAYNFNLGSQNVGLNATNASLNAQNFSGGSTNLVAAVVQGYLSGSTSLEVSGPCRWEVVEFA
jgi:hypothetical protein